MKKIFNLIILSIVLVVGCNEENSILEPQNDISDGTMYKGRPILQDKLDDGGDDFIKLLDLDDTLIKTNYSQSFTVDGNKGDKLFIKYSWMDKNNQMVNLQANLIIPRNAFEGELTFDIKFDLENYFVELYPSPFTFEKPVYLNLLFSGIDLSGIDENNYSFDYVDGEPENIKYNYMNIDIENKLLEVQEAQIPHFSRYGWVRR
ncbi:MAG: hypothetical protein H6610_05650 [Ignavibacteriales bacterium]|nr:hypothetical protein [Ignavibacteriales bacterium]MCB9218924.1 hypothetical protein [Ignavibacteriales bacterium]